MHTHYIQLPSVLHFTVYSFKLIYFTDTHLAIEYAIAPSSLPPVTHLLPFELMFHFALNPKLNVVLKTKRFVKLHTIVHLRASRPETVAGMGTKKDYPCVKGQGKCLHSQHWIVLDYFVIFWKSMCCICKPLFYFRYEFLADIGVLALLGKFAYLL